MTTATPADDLRDPPALLSIAQAARRAGNRDLERAARRLLRERHGISITFSRAADGGTDCREGCPNG
jgi:hypothetical protein